MWDWELLKNGSGKHSYEIIGRYGNEDFQYTHAISYGSQDDVFCLHNHAMYELVYCIGGDVVYLAEGVRYELEPDSLLIINPTVPHKLFICSNAPFERHILYAYYAGNISALVSLISQCQPPVGRKRIGSAYYGAKDVRGLGQAFAKMSGASRSEDESISKLTPFFTQAMVAELFMMMKEKQPSQFSVGTSKTVDPLLLYLSRSFTQDMSLQDIADKFFVSKDYCNRIFRKATGMTVMQYIIYSRVLYAKQLLADGGAATDVARQVGFMDYSDFYRAYRKVTGRTPSDDYQISETLLAIPDPMKADMPLRL